jgi:PAS domain S-box-containing protein
LDYEATLAKVSELSVQRLADWCTVHVSDPRTGVRQISVSHRDPARVRFAKDLALKYPYDPESPRGVPQVLRTGQPEIYPHVTEELLRAGAKDEEHFRILRDLGMESAMVVPIRSRGRTLGAITFIATEPGRSYGPEDLSLGEALGDRAGLAIENAALYEEAKRQLEERRRSEAARALLAAAVESSEDAILTLTLDGSITSWNRGATRLYGFPEGEALGQKISIIIPEELRSEEATIFERVLRGERIEHFETRRRTKDGRVLDVSLTVSQICDAAGAVIGFSKIARDISERKKAEDEIRRLNATLEERVKLRTAELSRALSELESFTNTIAHDLRAPLRTMRGFSEVLLEGSESSLGPEAKDAARRIFEGAKRMDDLTKDLLAYGRVAQAPIEPEDVDLDQVAHELLRTFEGEIRSSSASVKVARPLGRARGSRTLLSQALGNLFSNACKFVPPDKHPEVEVGSERRNGRLRVWVRDRGIGIEPRYQDKLFKMFERLEPGKYPGTGIGLAIVQKAAERMGGRAGVESEPGTGSRFWIEIPACEQEA